MSPFYVKPFSPDLEHHVYCHAPAAPLASPSRPFLPHLPGHDEQLSHHARALSNVFLHQLRPRHTDKGAVGVVRDSTRQQRLACAGWPVQQHTLQTPMQATSKTL